MGKWGLIAREQTLQSCCETPEYSQPDLGGESSEKVKARVSGCI